jgi:hypothetical protein
MLTVGQQMVRVEDGMKGVVELVAMPGFEQYEELRVVYMDRGEKRIAGKREAWEPVTPPPRKLREEEIVRVAYAADQALRSIDKNEPDKWWRRDRIPDGIHDLQLLTLIIEYLRKRG